MTRLGVLLVAAGVVAGCGGAAKSGRLAPTTSAPSTASAGSSTTSGPSPSPSSTTAPAVPDGGYAAWVTAAAMGASPTVTLEVCNHLTGQAATAYAQQHGIHNGAPNDHIDVDTGTSATVGLSAQAQITILTSAQITGAPSTQPPNVAAFVSWASSHLARKVNGSFAGPLFQLIVQGGEITSASQIFEP